MACDAAAVTGLILCGGHGQRFGGVDKPLLMLDDRPLVAHVLERLRPQVGRVLISCRAEQAERYAAFGHPLVLDQRCDVGALAGVEAGLAAVAAPWCFVCAGDTPVFPHDLVARLLSAVSGECRAAHVADHHLLQMLRPALAGQLGDWLDGGGRRVREWLEAAQSVAVRLPTGQAVVNVNDAERLATLAREMREGDRG